jgi:hypothetical protein
MMVLKIINLCAENRTTHLNTLFILSAQYLNVNTGIPLSLWDVLLS